MALQNIAYVLSFVAVVPNPQAVDRDRDMDHLDQAANKELNCLKLHLFYFQ